MGTVWKENIYTKMKAKTTSSIADLTTTIANIATEKGLKVLFIRRKDPLMNFMQIKEGYIAIGTTVNRELKAFCLAVGRPNATHIIFFRDDYVVTNKEWGLECVKRLIETGWNHCSMCNSSCFTGGNCISCGALLCDPCIAKAGHSKSPCPSCGGMFLNL